MSTHPSIVLDEGLIDDIASRLDLRTPNREALRAVAAHVAKAGGETTEAVCDLATAVGKTYLAAGLIEYFAHQGVRNFLIVTPGRTILEKTVGNFTPGHRKSVLGGMDSAPVIVTIETFNTGAVAAALDDEDTVKLFVFSVQSLINPDKNTRRARKFQEWLGDDLYAYLSARQDLVILSDEHHVYSDSAEAFSAAVRSLDPLALVGLTATPARSDRDKVIYHYPLARAIADRYVKTPVLVGRKDNAAGREVQLRDGLALLAAKQRAADAYAEALGKPRVNAVMFIVANNIETASEVSEMLRRPGMFEHDYDRRVLTIHSRAADDSLLRLAAVEESDSDVRVIVSVDMLKEGWDVKNIFVICSFRPSISDSLTEQTLGRGLRLPWGEYTDVELLDTVEVLSHERYEALLERADVLLEGLVEKRVKVQPSSVADVVVITDDTAPTFDPYPNGAEVQGAVPPTTTTPTGNTEPATTPVLVGPAEESHSTAVLVGLAERQREADTQAAQLAQPVTARVTLSLPTVRRSIDPKPPLHLSDIPDGLFVALGQQVAAAGGTTLTRKRLDVVEDASSPTGLRLVPVEAEDIIDAAAPVLPYGDVELTLKRGLLASDFVSSVRKSDANAARRLAHALVTGAGGDEHVAPYVNQVLAAAQKLLARQHRDAPEVELLTVDAAEFGPLRTNGRPEERNRYAKFSRGVAYGSWSDRAMHTLNWFDTEPERRMANFLDDADVRVPVWARIQRGEFVVFWKGGRYSPDFVATIDGFHHLIEVKGDDRVDDPTVQAKKAAAEQWARYVTDEGRYGTWRYLFVPQSVLRNSKTLDEVLEQARRSN